MDVSLIRCFCFRFHFHGPLDGVDVVAGFAAPSGRSDISSPQLEIGLCAVEYNRQKPPFLAWVLQNFGNPPGFGHIRDNDIIFSGSQRGTQRSLVLNNPHFSNRLLRRRSKTLGYWPLLKKGCREAR